MGKSCRGIHFTLNAFWEQQTEALAVGAGGELYVSGYFQAEKAANLRGEDTKEERIGGENGRKRLAITITTTCPTQKKQYSSGPICVLRFSSS